MNGQVVIFRKGQRISRKVSPGSLGQAKAKVKELKAKGVKAHLVFITDRSLFPPPNEVEEHRNEGQLWCPYCRAWRWFTIPKFVDGAEIFSEDWYMNSFHRQEVRVCRWCHISTSDFHVRRANGIAAEVQGRRRSRKKRRR